MAKTQQPSAARNPDHLALAPFPILNPLNWGAMNGASVLASQIAMLRLSLHAWQAMSDSARALAREQQELTLNALEALCVRAADGQDAEADAEQAEAAALAPLADAIDIYGRFNRAMLSSQQQMLEALRAPRAWGPAQRVGARMASSPRRAEGAEGSA